MKRKVDEALQPREARCSDRNCRKCEHDKLSGLEHFRAAFLYSMSGLRFALKETAFQQELFLGTVHLLALTILHISFSLALLLTALYAVILIVELMNSAIEATVDMVSPTYNLLAKKAKDLASAAVFVAILTFIVSWAITLIFI